MCDKCLSSRLSLKGAGNGCWGRQQTPPIGVMGLVIKLKPGAGGYRWKRGGGGGRGRVGVPEELAA